MLHKSSDRVTQSVIGRLVGWFWPTRDVEQAPGSSKSVMLATALPAGLDVDGEYPTEAAG